MLTNKNDMVTPFLKWAGGKRWFVEKYSHYFPKSFNRYIEPFLGSGSVFFSIQPKDSILSDTNKELIETYEAIRDSWCKVYSTLKYHQKNHSTDYYYKVRSAKPRTAHTRAARFIYLNRTCWNGLYRVNSKGKFNVPIGTKSSVLLDTDNFEVTSRILKKPVLASDDFEKIINVAQKNDFVFVDPPYTVNHSSNGFIKYNEKLFTWEDQIRLAESIKRAYKRGATVCLLNADHQSIRDLYLEFEQIPLSRKSVIAANSKHRGTFSELLVRCK